jgi:hypothetical protein
MPIKISGVTSGSVTLDVPAVSGTSTIILPAANDTLVGINSIQTLANKTLTTPVLNNPTINNPVLNSPTLNSSLITNSSTISLAGLPFYDFTSIPSWVKTITINFHLLSTTTTSPPIIQIGTSAGIQTSGYTGSSVANGPGTAVALWTSQFTLGCNSSNWFANNVCSGSAILTLLDAATGTWCFTSNLGNSVNAYHYFAAGSKQLGGILDRVRLINDGGTGSYDNGFVNILYE